MHMSARLVQMIINMYYKYVYADKLKILPATARLGLMAAAAVVAPILPATARLGEAAAVVEGSSITTSGSASCAPTGTAGRRVVEDGRDPKRSSEEREIDLTGASSSARAPSTNAADFLFAPIPISRPTCWSPSCSEGKAKRCKLEDLALGVAALFAPPLRAEPAGELGSDAIRNRMGCKGGL